MTIPSHTSDHTPVAPGQMLALVNTPHGPTPAALRAVAAPQAAPDEAIVEVHAVSLNRGELALLATRPEGWRLGQDIATTPARLAALPDAVGVAAAAALPMAGLTALRTLRLGGALLGQRVLVTGATGGVGGVAVQLARRAGARVTGVKTAAEIAEGTYDLILESVGGASLTAAIAHVAPAARWSCSAIRRTRTRRSICTSSSATRARGCRPTSRTPRGRRRRSARTSACSCPSWRRGR